ncbi:hypothetical protein [Rhodococcus sp. UFZ-B548]|uniref:hypothetical protein n=1 Tax=Rhodococcus sp. UFZ-B548 TaxID=2742212 RepID=UPI0015F5BCBC|nr:hypothetical protein [Rhodococcus sp. UFZ-B548]
MSGRGPHLQPTTLLENASRTLASHTTFSPVRIRVPLGVGCGRGEVPLQQVQGGDVPQILHARPTIPSFVQIGPAQPVLARDPLDMLTADPHPAPALLQQYPWESVGAGEVV